LWDAIHLPVDCTRRSIIENDPTGGPSAINEFIRIMAHLRASNTPVTLANWRQPPFNQWGFRNVRELLPTANIARSDTPTVLPLARRHLEAIAFDDRKSEKTTVADALRTSHTDGFLVLHRGQIVSEWYAHGLTPSTQHLIFSVSKSVAGTVAGILADQSKLDPDAPVTAYLPELKESVYGTCIVRHLLDMSVGIHFDEDYDATEGDVVNYRRSSGWDLLPPGLSPIHQREYLRTLRPDGTPHGHTFHYVSPNTDVLGWVFERACGMSYASIVAKYLWGPLGAESDAYITLDSQGAARVAGGICATLRDLARFGEMMRNDGISNGKQVVPTWWIDDIRNNGNADAWSRGKFVMIFPNGNYRNKWYTLDRSRTVFAAIGIHGQWIYIDPAAETVIVRVSSQPLPMDLDFDRMWMRGYDANASHLADGR
jgi:CubicO group peptidase (beta-lactamase class C family)